MYDILIKNGFTGSSFCHLCRINGEYKEHLFKYCHLINNVWERGATMLQTSKRDIASVNATILN